MHLQSEQILRRQGNRRGRGIDRHRTPSLFQLPQTLRNASATRRQNQGVPILCRRQVHQVCYCSEGNDEGTKLKQYGRIKEHLSYGGRVTLRRCPFFMASNTWIPGGSSHEARKNKQANTGLRPSFHCVCLLGRARSASRRAGIYR